MNRHEFMEQLERLLSDVSYAERQEALQYYNDYFDDAGVENEQEVIKALGNPAKVAAGIKSEMLGEKQNSGEFTEKGFSAGNETKFEVQRGTVGPGEQSTTKEKEKMSGWLIALIVVLCVIASPAILGAAGTVFGVVVAVICSLIAIVLAVAAAGVALLVAGVAVGVAAFIGGTLTPFGILGLIGCGLVLLALGVLFIMLTVWLAGVAIPWVIKGIIKLCKKIFGGKGGNKA